MTTAIVIRIFLILGKRNIRQKINAKIVAVWPDGKECQRESKLKISIVDKLFE
jgi:hypothetical protein